MKNYSESKMHNENPTQYSLSLDDIALFADHWVSMRKDGTPVLNGSPEDFELSLRILLDRLRK